MPQRPRQACGGLVEEQVADRMAERIIDALESVETERQHREPLPGALGARNRAAQLLLEHVSIRQARQAVVVRELPNLLLGELSLGDVLDRPLHPYGDAGGIETNLSLLV